MLDGLEDVLHRHEHTIAALEAVSTFAAVVVSLMLSLMLQRSNRTSIKASATVGFLIHSTLEGKDKPTYVTANITNTGIMPVMIPLSFFHWRVPFKRETWFVTPLDYSQTDEWVPQKKYPVEIKPRGSETFFLTEIGMFRELYREIFTGLNFFDRCRFRFFRAQVVTDDGKIFNVKMHRKLRKELQALRIAARGRNVTP